jgi:hypothetical protein
MFAPQGRAPRAAAVGLVLLTTGAAAFAPVPVCSPASKPALCFLLFTGQPRGERKPWRLFGKLSSCVHAAPCPRPCAARIATPQVPCTLQLAWPDAVRQSACGCAAGACVCSCVAPSDLAGGTSRVPWLSPCMRLHPCAPGHLLILSISV